MKNKTLAGLLATTLLATALVGCKKKPEPFQPYWDYEQAEFLDADAEPKEVATSGIVANYTNVSYDEKAKILGILEKYAIENGLTGLSLFANGGYAKYNPRIEIPTKVSAEQVAGLTSVRHDYILGYGFGVLAEGKLNGPLTGLTEAEKPSYYHTYQTDDPNMLNYGDDKGSVVGDLQSYVTAGYFDVRGTESVEDQGIDGYEWYPSLASEANVVEGLARPIPMKKVGEEWVNYPEPTLSTKSTMYKIYVRTGDSAKYATKTAKANLTAFNGRNIALADYLTPFKMLWNQSNGWARGGENLTGSSSIKGSAEFYNATKSAPADQAALDALFAQYVGIKTGTDATGDYLTFEFNNPCTPYYAMYYVSSGINAPVPQAFIDAIGGPKYYQKFKDGEVAGSFDLTPIDTTLSTGPFVVEEWKVDQYITFANNTVTGSAVKGGANRYKAENIPGIYVQIVKAAKSDTHAIWNLWKANKIDVAGIPQDKITEEANTDNTQLSKGDSVFKLNINSCDQETWEYLFGEEGVIVQTPRSQYWEVKPILSNKEFLKGLNLCIDRKTYAENRGRTPSIDYFADNYLSDPENGTSYNATTHHKNALKAIYTDGQLANFGYDPTAASTHFAAAASQLIAAGKYSAGDSIELEICWQDASDIEDFGADIKEYVETAWNNANTGITLTIKNIAPAVWSDVYYKKMMPGQFDLGFGSISGNTMDPLNFFEVLRSDNSSGFTLNWGTDTSKADSTLVYDSKQWSFNALWTAADHGAVVNEEGEELAVYDAVLTKNVKAEDGGRDVEIKVSLSEIDDVVKCDIAAVVLCYYEADNADGYDEVELEYETDYTIEDGKIIIHVSKEQAEAYSGEISFDIVFFNQLGDQIGTEKGSTPLISLSGLFPYYVTEE